MTNTETTSREDLTYDCRDKKCGGTLRFQGLFGQERFARYLCDGCGTSTPEGTVKKWVGLCERLGCESTATHKSGIGNAWHETLCPEHTNERVAQDSRVWFRYVG